MSVISIYNIEIYFMAASRDYSNMLNRDEYNKKFEGQPVLNFLPYNEYALIFKVCTRVMESHTLTDVQKLRVLSAWNKDLLEEVPVFLKEASEDIALYGDISVLSTEDFLCKYKSKSSKSAEVEAIINKNAITGEDRIRASSRVNNRNNYKQRYMSELFSGQAAELFVNKMYPGTEIIVKKAPAPPPISTKYKDLISALEIMIQPSNISSVFIKTIVLPKLRNGQALDIKILKTLCGIVTNCQNKPERDVVISELVSSFPKARTMFPKELRPKYVMNNDDSVFEPPVEEKLTEVVKLSENKEVPKPKRPESVKLRHVTLKRGPVEAPVQGNFWNVNLKKVLQNTVVV